MPEPTLHAIVSIHDVMPQSMDAIDRCLEMTRQATLGSIILLVVPGCDWQASDIRRLQRWHADGHQLAAHGWIHDSGQPRGLWHRLHSTLISRQVAEHLALDAEGIAALLTRSRQWFSDCSLPVPDIYVPPAWAMGSIDRNALTGTGFRWFEYQHGIFDAKANRFHRLPVMGFEADTALRAGFLRHWNRINARASSRDRPARLSIHPDDPDLLLSEQLQAMLDNCTAVALDSLDRPLPQAA